MLGADLTGAVGLAALIDGGIDAVYVGSPTPAAGALLAERSLASRRVGGRDDDLGEPAPRTPEDEATAGVLPVVSRVGTRDEPGRGFEISVDGRSLGSWDAVVVTGSTVAAVATVIGVDVPWYGGVFHPRADGVYLVGSLGGTGAALTEPAGAPTRRAAEDDETPGPDPGRQLAWAQASWVGEHLRGRYLLPAYQAMLDHPGLRRVGLRRRGLGGYRRALDRELRAGRARAAAAGYPLPLPAAAAAAAARARARGQASP
ncbi:hypothetical protein BL253_00530 [Pseudofrankia asymbiotica]|uniref:Uncharacterized protein n=1 Tax=Pseudofrankia asymbiotica TaxID=1834516 RepID=A0A1V2IL57_9ACTN|nr:hypothetical protein BL253_00530 [Pseudofrankia asymbiotica]